MTHDELLAKINEYQPIIREELFDKDIFGKWRLALRAVVELTMNLQDDDGFNDDACWNAGYNYAMYEIIQAIKKELK